jgi:hypothetical protein
MKATESFTNVITEYIAMRAVRDDQFAISLGKEGKNIDDCVTYILNQVKKSGCNAFTDAEVYGMAVHYFDEDNLEVGQPVNCEVIHAPEAVVEVEPETETETDETDETDEPDETEPEADETDETDEPEQSHSKSQLSLF